MLRQWIVYLLTGMAATSLLLLVHLVAGQYFHPKDYGGVIGCCDCCGQYAWFLFPYSMCCFPVAITVASIVRMRTVTDRPLDFLIGCFFCYQIIVFACLLCALNGLEPFVWLGPNGARLGIDSVTLPNQVMSIALAVVSLTVFAKLDRMKLWQLLQERKFLSRCGLLVLMGFLFNIIWFFLPPYRHTYDYFGSMADLQMGSQIE